MNALSSMKSSAALHKVVLQQYEGEVAKTSHLCQIVFFLILRGMSGWPCNIHA